MNYAKLSVIAIVFVVVVMLMSCKPRTIQNGEEPNEVRVLEEIMGVMVYEPNVPSNFADQIRPELKKQSGFELPQSAKISNVQYDRGLDERILLKFSINKGDLLCILHKPPFDQQELRSDRKYCSEIGQPPWWDVINVTHYLSGQAILKNSKSLSLLINLENESQPVIYLEFY